MDRQRIAKHLIESSEMSIDDRVTSMTPPQNNSEKQFFRFVDKNPFFEDNHLESVNKYLLTSRKKRHIVQSTGDESYELLSDNFSGPDTRKRNN